MRMGAGGAGFPPSHVRWSALPPAAGDKPQPYIRSVVIVSLVVGDVRRRYRGRRCRRPVGTSAGGTGFPALPGPVVGASLAVGDVRRPYIRTVLPPAGWG